LVLSLPTGDIDLTVSGVPADVLKFFATWYGFIYRLGRARTFTEEILKEEDYQSKQLVRSDIDPIPTSSSTSSISTSGSAVCD